MIHGETRIVLRNPISNNILKDVTSENTFQNNVIANSMRSLGRNWRRFRTDSDMGEDLWKFVVGGLFLFRDSIQAPASFMPKTNVMVGNGCWNLVNNDAPNELGSYNTSESSATPSAIRQVYDFSTQQANGQIGCVALTSRAGGLIGYGNNSKQVIATSKRTFWDANTEGYPLDQSGWVNVYHNNICYQFTISTGPYILHFRKKYTYVTQGSLKAGMFSEEKTYDFSSEAQGTEVYGIVVATMGNNGKILLACRYNGVGSVPPNGNVYYWEFDIANETVEKKTVKNTSSVTLSFDRMGIGNGIYTGIGGSGVNTKVYVFDLETSAHIDTLEDTDYAYGFNALTCMPFMGYSMFRKETASDGNVMFLYDKDTRKLLPTNLSRGSYNEFQRTCEDYSIIQQYGYGNTTGLCNNPLYLATINNLNSPVTKTSAQTMKVTYTLTEA